MPQAFDRGLPLLLKMSNCLKARCGIEETVEVKPAECRRVPLLKVAVADFRYFVEIGTAICMKPQLGLQRGVLFLTSSLRRQTENRIDRASFWRSPLFWCVDRLLPLTRSVSPERPRWLGEPVAYWLCATCTGCILWDRARGATKLPNQLSEIDARCLVNCPQCKGAHTVKEKKGVLAS